MFLRYVKSYFVSRISSTFQSLGRQNRKALIPFITAGDPAREHTVPVMNALVEHGADLLELGIPFSDPMADGPIIQRASERALGRGVSLADVLQMVEGFRRSNADTPILLMGYLNPVEIFGYEEFARQAGEAGVDGVILVDMPPEESMPLNERLREAQIDQIFLITPATKSERMEQIIRAASGFIYYVSIKGVTGTKSLEITEVSHKIEQIKQRSHLPVAVGFGIKDAKSAGEIAGHCDAVIIGSALVEKLYEADKQNKDLPMAVEALMSPIRSALDQAA